METNNSMILAGYTGYTSKSPKLQTINNRIAKLATLEQSAIQNAVQGMASVSHDLAVELAKVEDGKLYKADGLDSLAAYCEKMGIAKNKAHSLAQAGRIYNSDKAPDSLKTLPYSKLDALMSMWGDKDGNAQILADSDKLSMMSQCDIREYAKEWRETHHPKVEPLFACKHGGKYIHKDGDILYQTKQEWLEFHSGDKYPIGKNATGEYRFVDVDVDENATVYTLSPKPKDGKPSKPSTPAVPTIAQMAKLLGVTVEQLTALQNENK